MPNNVANQTKIQFLLDCLRAISANRPTPTLRMQRSRARALRYTMRWVEKVMLGKESTTLTVSNELKELVSLWDVQLWSSLDCSNDTICNFFHRGSPKPGSSGVKRSEKLKTTEDPVILKLLE